MTTYGPAITNLGYIAWKSGEPAEAESLFKRAIEDDPLHTRRGAQQPGADPARQGPPRASGDGEEATTSRRP